MYAIKILFSLLFPFLTHAAGHRNVHKRARSTPQQETLATDCKARILINLIFPLAEISSLTSAYDLSRWYRNR